MGTGNAGNQPVEIVESTFPLHVREYALADDAGGVGRYRGGLPVRRVIQVQDDFVLTVTGERARRSPYGLAGGGPGRRADLRVNPGSAREQVLRSKTAPIALKAGDVVLIQAAGGGGLGDVRERDNMAVTDDVADGYVSTASAAELYAWTTTAPADQCRRTHNVKGVVS